MTRTFTPLLWRRRSCSELASLIGGPVITGLINAYKAKLDAANIQDRIAADLAAKEIEAEIAARKEASAIIIAEQGRWYTAIIRPLLAFPLVIYLWKVIVWDKVLGLGTTDPITGMVADWTGTIITAYVGGRSIGRACCCEAKGSCRPPGEAPHRRAEPVPSTVG
jgi:hypothetical protein